MTQNFKPNFKPKLYIFMALSQFTIFAAFILSFNFSTVFADIVKLKNDNRVEGKVIEKTDKYIKVDTNGVISTYLLEDIEKITYDRFNASVLSNQSSQPDSQSGPQSSSDLQGEPYVNEECGFEMKGPKGWFKHSNASGKSGAIWFTKQSTEEMAFPMLGISIDRVPANIETALDFSKLVLPQYQAGAERMKSEFKLIESPQEIEVNGIKGARFIFEMVSQNGSNSMRSMDCKFMKDNLVISLQGVAYPGTFQEYLKDFEDAVNSFRFINSEDALLELEALNKIQLEFKPIEETEWMVLKNQILATMAGKSTFKTVFVLRDRADAKLAEKDFISMQWEMIFISPKSFEINQNNKADIWRVVDDKIYIQIGVWMEMPTMGPDDSLQEMIKARREIYKILSPGKYQGFLEKEAPAGVMKNAQDKYTVIQFKPQQSEDLFTGKPHEGSFNREVLIWVLNKDNTIVSVKTLIDGSGADGREIKQEYRHYFSGYNSSFQLGVPEMDWMKGK